MEAFGVGDQVPEEPEIPDCFQHVWGWWWQLNARRPPGFESPLPLSFTEISHWGMVTGTQITPEEVELLIRMDDAYLQQLAIERQERHERDQENAKHGKR